VKIPLPRPVIRDPQPEHRFTALSIIAVGELQHAAVGFCNLAAQDQTNAAAAVLGGKEWNKKMSLLSRPDPYSRTKISTAESGRATRISRISRSTNPRRIRAKS
jgi:hypothetical protein